MLRTAVITGRQYLKHFAGRAHPERPERVAAMIEMAEDMRRPDLGIISPRAATIDEIAMVHDRDYIRFVERTGTMDRYDFDPDTHVSRDSYKTALLAAGGVLTATEAVMDGDADNAFAIVRPPGHHALPGRAMGFCLFNNIAIAAQWLLRERGLKRVMIVDWDVHHGNGTQEMFYESANVLYVSTHQFPHYPGTGSLYEIGAGDGTGFTVNAPMSAEMGDAEYIRAFDELILPIGRKFNPEFILISSGFDCHYRDPLASMRVTEDGFIAMAQRVKRLAAECCGGKMAAALEGGYDLEALINSGRAVIEEFGHDPADKIVATREAGDGVMPMVERASQNVGRFWGLS
ncbi:MAG TPA: histone deacetylase [Candidatus Binataceae bacterium]